MIDIIQKAKDYKRKIAGSYISITKDDISSKIIGDNVYVTTKIDGEFNLLYFDGTKTILVNSNGKIKDDLPLLETTTALLKSNSIRSLCIACELHIKSDTRCRVSQVISAIANDKDALVLSGFDIISINDEDFIADNYSETIDKITELFDNNDKINAVPMQIVNHKEVLELYDSIVVQNEAEGLVVRSDETPIIYKIKPLHTLDAAIIGFTLNDKNSVRELLLGMLDEDNNYIQIGRVGTGLSDELKTELFDILNNQIIDSSYIEADKRRVAFAMVKPTVVVEISINELTTQTSKGNIKNQLLSYDDISGYSFNSSINGTSLVHPVFKRIRTDKSVNQSDVRYKQITDIVYIDNDNSKQIVKLPKSEIIFREVYTKVAKNKTNVQKFIVWKTNKETIDDKYPAYVMNYTNFSPTRGEPLKKDVRISNSQAQIMSLMQAFKDKNIKKGWNLVE